MGATIEICRIPKDQTHLEFVFGHYRDLAEGSGLSISEFARAISRRKGFLGDHE